jgi:hypothetical protein
MEAREGDCAVTLSVVQSGLTNPTYQVGSAAPEPLNSSSSSLPITLAGEGTTVLTFKNGDGTVLRTVSLESSCLAPTAWNSVKTACAYHFDRANLMTNGAVIADTGNGTLGVAYPQLIVGTTLTPLKNETGVQVGLCLLSAGLLGPEGGKYEGLPSAACVQPQLGNIRAVFPVEPVTGTLLPKLYEYTARPPGAVYYGAPYGTFGDSPYVAQGVSQSGMFIDVPNVGTYYYTDSSDVELWLTRDGFLTSELIKAGEHNIVLMTYTNPAP